MAVGEKRSTGVISQVSWTDGTAQDVYYGQEHSFQYSANINCDDELHGIKLSNYARFTNVEALKNCQLVSVGGNGVIALKTNIAAVPHIFDETNSSFDGGGNPVGSGGEGKPNPDIDVCPGVVFQDKFWYGVTIDGTNGALCAVNNTGAGTIEKYKPQDHADYTDESISTPTPQGELYANGSVSAILNYNNTRLVVAFGGGASGTSIWVYYPELDNRGQYVGIYGQTGWKKVLEYEAGVDIVGLTCTFEYLKVWAVDEGWNTKVYYYQGNNNLRSTFVYNVVDLTGVRVTRVYSINGIDYYVSSQDGTDGFVNLYKMVGNTPVSLFHQRGGLDPLDVNFKAPYFVGPCSLEAGYTDGTFYIADTYGLFRFRYTPQGYDKGYMKWKFNTNQEHPYGVCFNQGYLYVSTDKGCYKMRAYDTGVDGYQDEGVLISREYEGKEGGTITKMLDEIRLNFELNPNINESQYPSNSQPYGTIDVYVSPNNLWKDTNPSSNGSDNWFKVLSITKDSKGTRTEKSNLFNDLQQGESAFKFDWQTITYAIVITRGAEPKATPIVRQIDIRYHTKDKVNNVYDIN